MEKSGSQGSTASFLTPDSVSPDNTQATLCLETMQAKESEPPGRHSFSPSGGPSQTPPHPSTLGEG